MRNRMGVQAQALDTQECLKILMVGRGPLPAISAVRCAVVATRKTVFRPWMHQTSAIVEIKNRGRFGRAVKAPGFPLPFVGHYCKVLYPAPSSDKVSCRCRIRIPRTLMAAYLYVSISAPQEAHFHFIRVSSLAYLPLVPASPLP